MKTLVEALKKVKDTAKIGHGKIQLLDAEPPQKDSTFVFINVQFGYVGFASDAGIKDLAEEHEDDSILDLLDLKIGQMGTIDDENYYIRMK